MGCSLVTLLAGAAANSSGSQHVGLAACLGGGVAGGGGLGICDIN